MLFGKEIQENMAVTLSNNDLLYKGHTAAQNAFITYRFPRYTADYVHSQPGLKGVALQFYRVIYESTHFIGNLPFQGASLAYRVADYTFGWAARFLNDKAKQAAFLAYRVADFALGWALRPLGDRIIKRPLSAIYDTFYPVNPIVGNRQFRIIPRRLEKLLGDYLIYPFNLMGTNESHELLTSTQTVSQCVAAVVQKLTHDNKDLLNPPEEIPFEYKVKTITSMSVNAFSLPGGGMMVTSQFVKNLQGAIESKTIKKSLVTFADGTEFEVDLSKITLGDVLAALIGHEIAHAASRHTLSPFITGKIKTVFRYLCRKFFIFFLKNSDKKFIHLESKDFDMISSRDKAALEGKQMVYNSLDFLLMALQSVIEYVTAMSFSKKREYEADIAGTYIMQRAGFNPLGAIYAQELLKSDEYFSFIKKNFAFLYSHPWSENRKRATLAAISQFSPKSLRSHVVPSKITELSIYEPASLSPGYNLSREIIAALQ